MSISYATIISVREKEMACVAKLTQKRLFLGGGEIISIMDYTMNIIWLTILFYVFHAKEDGQGKAQALVHHEGRRIGHGVERLTMASAPSSEDASPERHCESHH